ncbi:MAG: sigma-70 family RNA polymerase sigma factor [Nitrospinota bacterium]
MTDIFALYYADLQRYPVLTRDEEIDLAHLAAAGDIDARNQLVEGNLRFVVTVAAEFEGQAAKIDLIAAGNAGMMRAAERFDPLSGHKFITYAVWWVRASMQELCYTNSTVRIPQNRLARQAKIRRLIDGGASKADAATTAEIDEGIVNELLSTTYAAQSLDRTPEGYQQPLIDSLPDDRTSPAQACEMRDTHTLLGCLVESLPSDEAYAMRKYYGLDSQGPMTLESIGRTLGRTRERVRQLLVAGLCRLRKKLALHEAGHITSPIAAGASRHTPDDRIEPDIL